MIQTSIINQLTQLALKKAESKKHWIPAINLAMRRVKFYAQGYKSWTEHYLEIDNIKRDLISC
jgi:hypothetical protein